MNDSKFKNCSAKTSEISCLQQKIKFDVNKPKYGNCGKQPKKSSFLVEINIILKRLTSKRAWEEKETKIQKVARRKLLSKNLNKTNSRNR